MNKTYNTSEDFFSRKMFSRLLVPSMISYFGLAFGDIADAVVVGNKLGVVGLAAISFALPVFMFINVIIHGFGAGGSIVYSRLMGEGKDEDAVNNFNSVFKFSIILSVIFAVLGNLFIIPLLALLGVKGEDTGLFRVAYEYIRIIVSGLPLFTAAYILNYYLRNDGNEKIASIGFTFANVIDIILNIVFVLILDWGAKGAAYSTLIGQIIAIALYLPSVILHRNNLKFKLRGFKAKEAVKCFSIGFSSSVQYIFSFVFILSANNLLIRIGSDVGVAVFEIIQNTSMFILYIYEGVAKAAQPLVSTFYGERNQNGMRKILGYSMVSGCIFGGLCIILAMIFPEIVCRVFGISGSEVLKMGTVALRIYCISAFFAGVNLLLECYEQSKENKKDAFVIALLRGAVILIPLTLVFSLFGIKYFWWLFPTTEILTLIISVTYITVSRKKDKDDYSNVYTCTIASEQEVGEAIASVEAFCLDRNASPEQVYYVVMVFEELCVAIMKQFQDDNIGRIQVTVIAAMDGEFELHVRDNAVLYNPFEEECKKIDIESDFEESNIGILLIKSTAKEFFYRRYQGFSTLVVRI